MNNQEKSIEQIATEIKTIEQLTKYQIEQTEEFAKKFGFSVHVDEAYYILNRIKTAFPETEFLQHFGYYYRHDELEIPREIQRAIYQVIPNALQTIGFNDMNVRQKTIKLRTDKKYYLYLMKYFGFTEESFLNVVKKFQNGLQVIQLNAEDFEKFEKLVNFTNPETQRVLEVITEADRQEYKIFCKDSSANPYWFVGKIEERAGIVGGYDRQSLNHRLIFEALK